MENLRPPRVLVESFWDATPKPEDALQMVGRVDQAEELELEALVSEVLRVNPTLEAAEATWQSAIEVHPQVTAFHDPQFRFLNGPTLFGNNAGVHLWRLQFQQEIPWYGKRGLRGEIADYGAEASRLDLVLARRHLQTVTTDAFLEYALAERTYALALEDHRLAREQQLGQRVRLTSAEESFLGDEPTLEELEELELEVLEMDRARDQIERARHTARRRVNTLLRRDPRHPLPPPRLPDLPRDVPEERVLIERALETRPEIAAARTREQSALSQVALAYKDFYPDFFVVGRFDTNADQFWWPEQLHIRPQLGFNLYAPIQQRRRWARVRQTEALVRNERAKRQILEDEIRKGIRDLYADLEYLERRRSTLDRLVAAAERRVNSRDEWVVLSAGEQTTELIAARRKLLKYQMEQLAADFQWQQHIVQLHSLSGSELGWGALADLPETSMPVNQSAESSEHSVNAAEPFWQDDEVLDFSSPPRDFPDFPDLLPY